MGTSLWTDTKELLWDFLFFGLEKQRLSWAYSTHLQVRV